MRGGELPMTYEITTFDAPHRVVLAGSGSSVVAVDDIRFEQLADGTRIDYIADIRLRGLLRLAEPFAGRAFAKVGRDAREGMQRALRERAAAAAAAAATGPRADTGAETQAVAAGSGIA
jgi:hypothetical protein